MNGEPEASAPSPAVDPQPGNEVNPPSVQKSFFSTITRSGVEKAMITAISIVFGGALLYYLHEFKANQDAMTLIMASEHGIEWAKSNNDHISIHDLWQKEEQFAKDQQSLKDSIQKLQSRTDLIIQWTERLRAQMASWGTNEHYGKANLNNSDQAVVYVNTRSPNGNWFKTGDPIVLTNRHRGAQGPEYSAKINSAYLFQKDDGTPDSESLVQISKSVATQLQLPLTDGVFEISIRKEKAVPFIPSVEEMTAKP
jgi:hypothetical protein